MVSLSLSRGVYPYPDPHTTSTEEPGSESGMNTCTNTQSADVRCLDGTMTLLSALKWLLSKHTVLPILPAC